MTLAQTPKGIKRRSPEAEPSMLSTLATISAQQLPTKDQPLSKKQPTKKQQPTKAEKRYKPSVFSTDHDPHTAALGIDTRTNLPAPDIIDELLSHNSEDSNLVGKILQPKMFEDDYRAGQVDAFLLLACMANNVMFSRHSAVLNVGIVNTTRLFVDRARALAPAALENPSVRNSQALLLLAMSYMHLGRLDVASHYSSITLRALQQLGVCTMDNNDCGDEDGWLNASWLDREQVRRVVWGAFTVDTFLALMQHTVPNVVVDLNGVNRPCASNMWYIGNDSLDTVSYPCAHEREPGDSEYLTALREAKHGGVPWTHNGSSVQLNFAVLGNTLLRCISDPQVTSVYVDRLVDKARRAVGDWLAPLPLMPPQPTVAEIQLTVIVSAAALCLKSVITPYLFARCRAADSELPNLRGESAIDAMITDYIAAAHTHYTHAYRIQSECVPPMFAAYSMTICGGMFAVCAHTAPTERLRRRFSSIMRFFIDVSRRCTERSLLFQRACDEIEKVSDMARFLPRRLTPGQLQKVRDAVLPGAIEAAVNRPFAQFIAPMAPILRATAPDAPPMRSRCGVIPLTSNLCAIFGHVWARSSSSVQPLSPPDQAQSPPKSPLSYSSSPEPRDVEKAPAHRLTFTAISSLMIGLAVAAKDESFFDFLPTDTECSSLKSILN
ncbi:hypothetical protein IW147_006256 [Coemansia sp. RSA 720]|nr:hypothetical protein IW147_006256 [Coemansia sp. RSA 720]